MGNETTPSVAEGIERAKAQFRADIATGVIPADIRSLADAHDHTDANYYGLFTDSTMSEWASPALELMARPGGPDDDLSLEIQEWGDEVTDALARWIEDGMPIDMGPVLDVDGNPTSTTLEILTGGAR